MDCQALLRILLLLTAGISPAASNGLPDTQGCCRASGVSAYCTEQLCDTAKPPGPFAVFNITTECARWLPEVSKCLADGRNHRPCCERRAQSSVTECLPLCDGSATQLNITNWDSYKRYVACLTLNIGAVFSCLREGYDKIPGPPLEIRSQISSPTSATVTWSPPTKLPHLVDHYEIYYRDSVKQYPLVKLVSQRNQAVLDNLQPDTKYVVYVLAVEADGGQSLHSQTVYIVTDGVAPVVEPYASLVHTVPGSMATLVCRVRVKGSQHIKDLVFGWERADSVGRFSPVADDTKRYRTTSYGVSIDERRKAAGIWSSADGSHLYLMTLKVAKVEDADMRQFRCSASNQFGSGSAEVQMAKTPKPIIPDRPSNVTACCEREGVQPTCLSTCKASAAIQPNARHAEHPLYPKLMCALDIPKVLKCTTAGLDYSACCLRRQVPLHCLPLCNGQGHTPLSVGLYQCLLHQTEILSCHMEHKSALPHPPRNIKAHSEHNGDIRVRWEPAHSATSYVLYYREDLLKNSASRWSHRITDRPQITLSTLIQGRIYEVVLLSKSEAGLSDRSASVFLKVGDNSFARDQPLSGSRDPDRLKIGKIDDNTR